MFTCISCRVAFETAAEQRSHFSTDWHRYNMKRRVANLPPVAAESFNEKVLERREQNAVRTDPRSLSCTSCKEAQQSTSHFTSSPLEPQSLRSYQPDTHTNDEPSEEIAINPESSSDQGSDDEGEGDFSARIAKARRRIQPTDCLFCSCSQASVEDNIKHMTKSHSFFIPDQDILLDRSGLLAYLGEKVAIGNLCLFCPNGGREFGSLEAVRKHMIDKAHCKIAYETDEDRAELADFYDFTGSEGSEGSVESDWEDLDESVSHSGDEQEVMEKNTSRRQMAIAPDGMSLMLPSGRTLGHRSLKVYYSQRLRPVVPHDTSSSVAASKVALVRQRLADPSLALVPVAGGHGAFGRGQELMKARNAGEAKWAKRQGRSFKDQKYREQFKTRVGFTHNNQKHFRDPLLQ
ncbi:hypothetical protein I302_100741 [Kwoniella bestiolae CBS 10118]|uniref:ZN622/Rei1/Reh1 zinc finger C2H2-type domain-containing protein n=1 Tax=Kwoniella bestiolae CBS 10118 TaxID=1296100 RepID=A0AAJ8M5U1_9TREE